MHYLIEPMFDDFSDSNEESDESTYQKLVKDSLIYPRRATQT